jgi:predicted  nucleic acid-binding Zn-ribbon protein
MADEARQYRNLISPREDRILELYDIVEATSNAEQDARRRLGAAREQHAESQSTLTADRTELLAVIATHERERAALVADVDPASLRTYESLLRTRARQAVAIVAQRTCQACRVSLPVNLEQRARSSEDLVLCQSCGRILYAGL